MIPRVAICSLERVETWVAPFRRRRARSRWAALTTAERQKAFSRALARLGPLIDAADDDPLVVADIAIALLGHANKRAANEFCSKDEWIKQQLWLASITVDTVAAWKEIPWPEALQMLADRLDSHHFEQEVARDIWELPE